MARDVTFDIIARDKASRTFDKVGDSSKTAGSRLAKFGKLAAIGLAVAGVAAVKFGISSVKAYGEAEQAQGKLSDAFARFPKLADSNIEAFRKLNTELARKTRFDDDATAAGQAQLAAFKLTGRQILQLTPLLQDYAAKTGKDLPTAASDFGKAMLGQGRSLKAIGLDFKDTGTATGNYTQLVKGLRTQVGGFAAKEGETFNGKLDILKNRFGELQEAVGEKLVPVLTGLATWILDEGIPALEDWGATIEPYLTDILGAFKTDIAGTGSALDTFNGALDGVGSTVGGVKSFFDEWLQDPAMKSILKDLESQLGLLKIAAEKLATAVGVGLTAAAAITKAAWMGLFWVFQNFVRPSILTIIASLGRMLMAAGTAADVLGMDELAGKLKTAGRSMEIFAQSAWTSLNKIQSRTVVINAQLRVTYDGNTDIARAISTRVSKSGQVKVRSVRMMAEGGPFSAGQMAIVGERGPELVQFGDSGRVIPNGQSVGGGGITVHVHNAVIGNEREIARVVTDAVRTATARGQLRPA